MADQGSEEQKPQDEIAHKSAMSKDAIELIQRIQGDVEKKLPITWLNEPEAHEDALKSGKNLWIEAMKILQNNDYAGMIARNGQHFTIIGKVYNEDIDAVQGTDLTITTQSSQTQIVNGEEVQYSNSKFYFLTPGGVILIERNWADASVANNDKQPRIPKGISIKKEELGRDEINELTQILVNRKTDQEIELDAQREGFAAEDKVSQPLLERSVSIDADVGDQVVRNLRKEINKPTLVKVIQNVRRRLMRTVSGS
ncbi:MAG: hypothetical protein M1444_01505 [Patescibacteria group bacterium]|nr:hypothetical protein [Patescibacteria group bacterium]